MSALQYIITVAERSCPPTNQELAKCSDILHLKVNKTFLLAMQSASTPDEIRLLEHCLFTILWEVRKAKREKNVAPLLALALGNDITSDRSLSIMRRFLSSEARIRDALP